MVFESKPDALRYMPLDQINVAGLRSALCNLHFLGDDHFLQMQATNLGITDRFVTALEYETLALLHAGERTPGAEAAFLGAISQMWIFAAYELLRTWRQRAEQMVKWAKSGVLEAEFGKALHNVAPTDFGRIRHARQIESLIGVPETVDVIAGDIRRTEIVFRRLEAIRMSLAKHEFPKKSGSVARMPGYGRINRWCGALDYDLESERGSLGFVSRRDIADGIRHMTADGHLPTNEEIVSFRKSLKGPTKSDPEKIVGFTKGELPSVRLDQGVSEIEVDLRGRRLGRGLHAPFGEIITGPLSADQTPTNEAVVSVNNQSGQEARLLWINQHGRIVPYGAHSPGSSDGQLTWIGHCWIVADGSGVVLATFRVEQAVALITIQ